MFNLLVWLITVACFAVALRATYLIAFERALTGSKSKKDPFDFPLADANPVALPASDGDKPDAAAELDEARQRNRDLVREVATLKEELHTSQSTAQSLQDRLDAMARRQGELSNEERARSAEFELAQIRSIYQNGAQHGDLSERREEALRQISEIEGEMAGLFSNRPARGGDECNEPAPQQTDGDAVEREELRRQLAERVRVHSEISDENLRLRGEIGALEHQLRDQAAEQQQVRRAQQSLSEIVAKLQALTNTTVELQRSLEANLGEPTSDRANSVESGTIQVER
ncbi:MAG: hypothetical protein FJ145_23280 [Deltaproteobacteria bacterium]|nr:hypothetical protein [Deltaproteobacteria bacterium]